MTYGTFNNTWLIKHGLYGTSFYRRYQAINTRCKNPKHPHHSRYGGRGIKNTWLTFHNFYDDMYASYTAHVLLHGERHTQLDRIDNDGNYSKENCRWTTPKQNSRNKLNNRLLTFRGQTKPMSQWAELIGLDDNALYMRLKQGWTVDRALTTPKFHGMIKRTGTS